MITTLLILYVLEAHSQQDIADLGLTTCVDFDHFLTSPEVLVEKQPNPVFDYDSWVMFHERKENWIHNLVVRNIHYGVFDHTSCLVPL